MVIAQEIFWLHVLKNYYSVSLMLRIQATEIVYNKLYVVYFLIEQDSRVQS